MLTGRINLYLIPNNEIDGIPNYNYFLECNNYNIVENDDHVEEHRNVYLDYFFNGNINHFISIIEEIIVNSINIQQTIDITFDIDEETAFYFKLKYPKLYETLKIEYKVVTE